MTSVVNENRAFRPRTRTGFPLDRYGPVSVVRTAKKKTSPSLHAIIVRSTVRFARRIAGKILMLQWVDVWVPKVRLNKFGVLKINIHIKFYIKRLWI